MAGVTGIALKLGGWNGSTASWAIWAFDRVVRVGRLVWSGFGRAESKLYPDDIFKMTISYSQRWKYYPGSHIYYPCYETLGILGVSSFHYLPAP